MDDLRGGFNFEMQLLTNQEGWGDVAYLFPALQVEVTQDELHTPNPSRTLLDFHSRQCGAQQIQDSKLLKRHQSTISRAISRKKGRQGYEC